MVDARRDLIFRRLFDAGIIGILLADTKGWITRANDPFLRLLGYHLEDLPLRWDNMTPPEWEPMDRAKRRELAETGIAQPWEKEYWHRDGHRVPILVGVALLEGSDTNAVGFVLDRTEQVGQQQQVQKLGAEIAVVEEGERRRIGKGIHDEIGQNLAVAKLKLDAVAREGLNVEARESLAQVRVLLDQSVQACRGLAFELASPVLYELGLEEALRDLAHRLEKDHGIRCEIESNGLQAREDPELGAVLFRVARELVHNVIKHARARTLKIRLDTSDQQIRIAIADDGIGFDVGAAAGGVDGFGLLSVKERVRRVGGRLEVDSRPGAGTRVDIVVPGAACVSRFEPTG